MRLYEEPSEKMIFGFTKLGRVEKVANFENDIASEKQLSNPNALAKFNEHGVILIENECSTYSNKNQWHFISNVFEINAKSCCNLSGPPCIYRDRYVCNAVRLKCGIFMRNCISRCNVLLCPSTMNVILFIPCTVRTHGRTNKHTHTYTHT